MFCLSAHGQVARDDKRPPAEGTGRNATQTQGRDAEGQLELRADATSGQPRVTFTLTLTRLHLTSATRPWPNVRPKVHHHSTRFSQFYAEIL